MSNYHPSGSLWKKWDLHVHTPASVTQNYGGNTEDAWEAFLKDLESLPSDFTVIGINDYIFVDGYERVLKAKKEGRLANLDLILPVVELRLDKFAGIVKKDETGGYSKSDWNRINLHVIFDQLDPEVIRQQFLSALVQCYHLIPDADHLKGKWQAVITPDSLSHLGQMIIDAAPDGEKGKYGAPLEEGFNNLCFSLDKVIEALNKHDLKDRYLLAVGKTEWENMKWTDQSIAEKRNVINCVDLIFTAAENPDSYEKSCKKLSTAKVLDKLLDCSDAHALSSSENKDRIGNCFTWIKADPTFEGLRHAVIEFNQRVYVGDLPPKLSLVNANRTKYAARICIVKKAGSTLPDTWFDVDVPLNHDLVAIIGNKGSGKSALSDIVALVGDTRNFASFSFLNEERFRDPKNNLAAHFVGTLYWCDNASSDKSLHLDPTVSAVERVKYLPQRYLEDLCNELAESSSSTFDGELRKIIYTHVPEEQRLDFQSLNELLDFKVSEIQQERKQLTDELSKINRRLVDVETKLSPAFRSTLEQQLDVKRNELSALDAAKPEAVEDPQQSDAARQETAAAAAKLAELETELQQLDAQVQEARRKKAIAVKGSAHVVRIVQAIRNHQKTHEQFVAELRSMLLEVPTELNVDDIVSLKSDVTKLEEVDLAFKGDAEAQDKILTDTTKNGAPSRKAAVEASIKEIKSKLGEKERSYLVYKEQLAQWNRARISIQGGKDKPNSIEWYVEQLALLDNLPQERDRLRTDRAGTVRRIHAQLERIVAEYKLLYKPVQNFVQSAAELDMPLPLDFNVRIAEEGFQEEFLSRVNRQARGSFAGIDESNQMIRRLLKEVDFSTADAVIAFAERIDDMLHVDRRAGSKQEEIQVADQLRKGQRTEELYDLLFGLDYLKPQYSLTYDGQEISQLSPGERGLLLLVFYLLVDKDDIPLVIDQPEENLDNQTIYKVLVTCIKAAKQRRQVVLVTHNPNLAVLCDAEQIIYASCNKPEKKFAYQSGAIESATIKQRVVDILEGTEPAFLNRQKKYRL